MEPIADPAVKKTARQRMEELAPEYLSELMTEFMVKADLVERQKIRRRIRAMLDLFSADTKWPQGRTEAPPIRRPQPGFGGLGQGAQYNPGYVQENQRPVQGDDLAEPPPAAPDAIPVPGAGLADFELPQPPLMV
jgi:hypothetical protein